MPRKRSEVAPKNPPPGWAGHDQAREAGETGRSIVGDGARRLSVPHDPVNEVVVLAACAVDREARSRMKTLPPDWFHGAGHAEAWRGILELERAGLDYDEATLRQLTGRPDVAEMIGCYVALRPQAPPNLRHHAEMLAWDHTRVEAVNGPLAALHGLLRNPASDREVVCQAARNVAEALRRADGMRQFHDPGELVRSQTRELVERREGVAVYPFGLEGLDRYESGEPRMIPGLAPGKLTVLVGVPGSAKTTFAGRVVLAQAFERRRRVLHGAWEVSAGPMLELMATLHLGWSRTAVMTGSYDAEQQAELERAMDEVAGMVRFVRRPAWSADERRGRRQRTNEQALDQLERYVADSGAEVFVADLFRRCLASIEPDEEELALNRMQAIAEQYRCSVVLVQQLRAKDVEQRADKRPTREAIKGSAAWFECPDTILGVHREALFKAVPDDRLEVHVMKQRWARWPLLVEHEWDPDRGAIGMGRTVDNPYVAAADVPEGSVDQVLGSSLRAPRRARR